MDCSFDPELDDYPNAYRVYVCSQFDSGSQESWTTSTISGRFIGTIKVEEISFDPTKRALLNLSTTALAALITGHLGSR